MKLHNQIFLGIGLGCLWGAFAQQYLGGEIYIGFLGDIFKRCLLMLIAPLVFASITTGVASLGDFRQLGRMGLRTVVFYFSTTMFAVLVGIILVNLVQPGKGSDARGLQINLEISRGVPAKLLSLAQQSANQGEPAEAYLIYGRYLDRYEAAPRRPLAEQRRKELRAEYSGALAAHELERSAKRVDRLTGELGGTTAPTRSLSEFAEAQIKSALKNPFEALARAEVMAIIVFAILLGTSLTTLGEDGKPMIRFFNALNAAMMKMVDWVMILAPAGVMALMAETIAELGFDALRLLFWYMLTVLIGLGIHGLIVLPAILYYFTRMGPLTYLNGMKPAMAVSFSTCSTSATLPVTMECTRDNLDCSDKATGFVLPLGATINMDGTALYESVAAIFIAQMFGIELTAMQQVLIFLTATLAAIGAASIPSAGTVTMAMVLTAVNLPLEGIGMILAVDRVLDMFRTTVNLLGDGIGTVVIDRMNKRDEEALATMPA